MRLNNLSRLCLFSFLIIIGMNNAIAQGSWCGSTSISAVDNASDCASTTYTTSTSHETSYAQTFCAENSSNNNDIGFFWLRNITNGESYTITADPPTGDVVLSVYGVDGASCNSNFTMLACVDASAGTESVTLVLDGYQYYYVGVHSYDAVANVSYDLCVAKSGGNSGGGSPSADLTCGDTYYDSGGPSGDYGADELETTLICPDQQGALLSVEFTSIELEGTYDDITVYDGNSTSAPTLDVINGNTPAGTIYSPTVSNTSGCLTFVFDSDYGVQYAGWQANITCQNPCEQFDIEFDTDVMTNDPDQNFEIFACKAGEPTNSSIRFSVKSLASEGKDDNLITWTWNFGDGNTATGKTVDHSYADAGIYSVSVVGVDENDCRSRNILEADVKISSPIVFNGTNLTNNDPTCVNDVFSLQGQAAAKVVKVDPPQPVVETTYLPDGENVCYEPTIDYTGVFQENATLNNVNDLINIFASIEHSWIGDLKISIECPTGQEVFLHNAAQTFGGGFSGGTSSNFGIIDPATDQTKPGTGYMYVWPSNSSSLKSVFQYAEDANFDSDNIVPAGSYASEESLAGLVGCQLNGEWKLKVCDLHTSDDGFVFEFGLEFNENLYISNEQFAPTVESLVWTDDQNPTTVQTANAANSNASIPSLTTVNYTLTATDNAGCISDTTIAVTTVQCDEPCVPPTVYNGVIAGCDDGIGISVFDLTSAECDIAPFDCGNTNFTWYSDASLSNEITGDLSNYSSPSTTLYVVVGEPGCTAQATLQLQINALTLADQVIQKCALNGDNSASFNLEQIQIDVLNGSEAASFEWYTDAEQNNAITTGLTDYITSGTTLYAYVEDSKGCNSQASVDLNVGEVEANNDTIELCANENGSIEIDLNDYNELINNSSLYTISWFEDDNFSSPVASTQISISEQETFYASVDDGEGCSNEGSLTILLTVPPTVYNGVYNLCDDGSGAAAFDLKSVECDIAPFDCNDVSFSWYSDEELTEPINDLENYVSSSSTVYVEVGNGCNAVAQMNLQIGNLQITSTNLSLCDNGSGSASFDLTLAQPIINDEEGTVFKWYEDAALQNEILNPSAFVSGTTTVYCQVTRGNCSGSVAIPLEIGAPTAISTTVKGCGNSSGVFDLVASESTITDGAANQVTWYEDIELNTLITNPDNYTSSEGTVYAVVGDDDCSATAAVTLELESIPTANDVTTNQDESIQGQGVADFNLLSLVSDINGGNGAGVEFFADGPNGFIAIQNLSSYSSSSAIIYAVTTSSAGCSDTAEITLQVNGYDPPDGGDDDDDELIDIGETDTLITDNGDTIIVNPGDSLIVIGDTDTIVTADGDTVIVGPGDTVLVEDGDTTIITGGGDDDLPTLTSPGNAAITLCGDSLGNATFNLNSVSNQIKGNASGFISWYLDETLSLFISNPGAYVSQTKRVYASVTGMEGYGYVDLYVVAGGDIGVSTELSRCPSNESGNAIFDLTIAEPIITQGSNLTVQWFEDIAAENAINNVSTYESASKTIFAKLTASGGCSGMVAVYLKVEELQSSNASLNVCDNGDSTGTFNLTSVESAIGAGYGYSVNWYEDASKTVQINDPQSFTSSPTTVYATIFVEGNESCSADAQVALSIGDIQAYPAALRACSGSAGAVFDLTEAQDFITGGIAYNVTWYTDNILSDRIGTPTAYSSTGGRVYAKVGTSDDCFSIAPVSLTVGSFTPQDTSFTYCGNDVAGLYYNLTKFEGVLTNNSGLDVDWFRRPNGLNVIETPDFYLPQSYDNGVHTIYAEVCGNMAEVQLVVFEFDSFKIATDANDLVISSGDQVQLGTSAGEAFNHLWSPANLLVDQDSTSSNPIAAPTTTTSFEVIISNDAGCRAVDTLVVYVEDAENPFTEMIAEIFSPDGNGENDVLFINGPGICEIDLKIFNRWGVIVFESNDKDNGWNGGLGNDADKPAPADDYRYVLRAKRCNAIEWMDEETGIITIVR